MLNNIIISITGPESTGKSTLSKLLADHFNTVWLPEYGREYLENLKSNYQYSDILKIAQKQIELEKRYASKNEIVFFDTDLINIKIWLEHYNYAVPKWLITYINSRPYKYSLLLYPDITWKDDGIREHPQLRIPLFNKFKLELEHYNYNFSIIKGMNKNRLKNALEIVTPLVSN